METVNEEYLKYSCRKIFLDDYLYETNEDPE